MIEVDEEPTELSDIRKEDVRRTTPNKVERTLHAATRVAWIVTGSVVFYLMSALWEYSRLAAVSASTAVILAIGITARGVKREVQDAYQLVLLHSTQLTVVVNLDGPCITVLWTDSNPGASAESFDVEIDALFIAKGRVRHVAGGLRCRADSSLKGSIVIQSGMNLANGGYRVEASLFAGRRFDGQLKLA